MVNINSNIPSKLIRVLNALTIQLFNRFEAEILLNDHCLNSTVSTIQNKYCIEVQRKWETVTGYMQIPTRVFRYWIASGHKDDALKLAAFWN